MKQTVFIKHSFGLLSALTFMTYAAAQNIDTCQTDPKDPPKWEEQIQTRIEMSSNMSQDQLRLLSCEYLGKVKTTEEMMALTDEMFDDETYTVISHPDENDQIEYLFFTWGELRKEYEYMGFKLRDDIRNEDIILNQTDVLSLTWGHNGNVYHSKAIASPEKGIIYDNIMTYAISQSYYDSLKEYVSFINIKIPSTE